MAKKGFGTKFQYLASTGPDVWTTIGKATKIRPLAKKADVIDGTSHESTAETREKQPGLIDNGDAAIDYNYEDTNAGHIWLEANVGVDGKTFRCIFPGTAPTKTVKTFSGFVQSVSPESPHDSKMTASVVISISGVVTTTLDGS